ncbi:MAG: hypothetical protein JKY81_04700 [Colwellia sp.]|nr:hypothetical protein [Colwellia sp.]
MGYGLDEDWEEEECIELTPKEKRIAANFDLDHEEWQMVSYNEKQRLTALFNITNKGK